MPVNAAWFKGKSTKCQGWLILVGVKLNSFKLIFSAFQFPALPRSILPLFLSPNLYFCFSLLFYFKNTKNKPTPASPSQLQLYTQAPMPPLTFLFTAKPQKGGCSRVKVSSAGNLTALQIGTFKATLLNEAIQDLKHSEVFGIG